MNKILDEFKKQQVIGILSVGGRRALAAQFVGCHPRTIYNEAQADPQFAAQLKRAETSPEYHLLKTVTDAGTKGVVHAAKWALERVYPDTYRPRKPNTFSYEAVKQFLEELIARLADQAPGETERTRILETGTAFARELRGQSPDWTDELRAVLQDTPGEEGNAQVDPAAGPAVLATDGCAPAQSPPPESDSGVMDDAEPVPAT